MPGQIGLATWRSGIATCGRSPVARRARSASTRGGNRRLVCHRLCRLVVCRTRRTTGDPLGGGRSTPRTTTLCLFDACRPCELVGRALRGNRTDLPVAPMHRALGHCSAGLGCGARGKKAPEAKHNEQVCSRMEREAKRLNRATVAVNTSVSKLPAWLASRMVCARLLTAAVSTEVKHIVTARRPLRRGSAGGVGPGWSPLVSCGIPARLRRNRCRGLRV